MKLRYKRYTEEQIDYIRKLFKENSSYDSYIKFTDKYPECKGKSLASFRDLARRHGIQIEVKCEARSIFPKEVKDYIAKNVNGKTCYDLANEINQIFGTNYSGKQISEYKKTNKIKSGWITPKGGNSGSFKKGNPPHNKREIGSIVIRDNYLFIKICDEEKRHRNYKQLNRLIYEYYHPDEKLTRSDVIYCIDGNRCNFSKENLVKVTLSENGFINSSFNMYGLVVGKDTAEFRETLLTLKRLNDEIENKS